MGKVNSRRKRRNASGMLEVMATDDIGAFRTASGEIIDDHGEAKWEGYLESSRRCTVPGHLARVHKPLISTARLTKTGLLVLMDRKGGSSIKEGSTLGKKIKELISGELEKDERQRLAKLYVENGVYNMYLQGMDGKWQAFNVDSGAGQTVLPQRWSKLSGGTRQAA